MEGSMSGPYPQLLATPKEAASMLRLSPRTLFTLTKNGELPSRKIGRLVRYYVPELIDWINGRRDRDGKHQ